MAKIVYATMKAIHQKFDGVVWKEGCQDSYADTKRMADLGRDICVIGCLGGWDTFQIRYAKSSRTGWRDVNPHHLVLLNFFVAALENAPEGKCLSQFFDAIEDKRAAKALVSLIAAECGINASAEQVERAIHKINADLEALGLVCGDWTFYPMMKTWTLN
jgi:S-adenosylmethionine:diacylglycerol 3-amino-3-carboxypropyl transferase